MHRVCAASSRRPHLPLNRPEPDTPEAQARSQAAAEWLARRDSGLSGEEQDAFLEWLAADPRHGEWLATHRRVMGDFNALATWRPEHSANPNPDLLAPAGPSRARWWLPIGLAAAAGIAVAIAWRSQLTPSPALVPAVAVEELKRRILEDGSAVELNRGAVVTTTFSPAERRAALVTGEAYFTVAKNPERPFASTTNGVVVRAVGTAFSVRLDAGSVDVLVTEGRVAVERAPAGGTAAEPALISAGQRATISLTPAVPPTVVPVTPQAMAQQLNWQPQRLDFSSAPLSIALAEFNRRNRVQFVLADDDLATVPIVASIRSDNVEGFARFLESSPSILVERRSNTEIVLHRRR
jgi:transmembrane sensor